MEADLEENIGILEQTLFETDDQELACFEVLFYHKADILSVAQIKRGVDLIQDVEWGWLVLKQG